jgi:hypothetical protein
MRCVACGKNARKVKWAVYADPAFAHKRQNPFPLHSRCFEKAQTIVVSEWRAREDDPQEQELVEFEQERYVEAAQPNEEEAD